MVTIQDIQIFITTYNRASLLQETLNNLLSQTIRPDKITVLDNNSSDNTRQLVLSYADKGVEYVPTHGFLGNFKKARQIVSRPYCMLFHDDDLLHPKYLESVLKLLNTYKNLSLVTCTYTPFTNGKPVPFPPALATKHLLFYTPRQWACYMYFREGVGYAPAVYRTDAFLQTQLEYEKYSKYNDWPFMLEISRHGPVAYLLDTHCLHVRIHPGQDSNNISHAPNIEQIVNWDACFFKLMGRPLHWDPLYWMYALHNRHFLLGKYQASSTLFKQQHPVQELKDEITRQRLPVWGFSTCGRVLECLLWHSPIFNPSKSIFKAQTNLVNKN